MKTNLKIKKIGVKNHRHLQNFTAVFADGVTEIWGLNESGKSAIFDLLTILIAGMKEKGQDCMIGDRFKVIGPAAKSMPIEAALIDTQCDDAKIVLSRTISGSGNGKLKMTAPKDYPHELNSEWLSNLLSAALLSPKYFCAKTGPEQAILLGCNTSEFDAKLKELKIEYRDLGRDLKPYENLEEVEKVEPVDIEELQKKKSALEAADKKRIAKIKAKNDTLLEKYYEALDAAKDEARAFNENQKDAYEKYQKVVNIITDLETLGYPDCKKIGQWANSLPQGELPIDLDKITLTKPEYADDAANVVRIEAYDTRIRDAYKTNEASRVYQEYLKKAAEGDEIKRKRAENQGAQSGVQLAKNSYVAGRKLPFAGMTIDENGGLLLEGKEVRPPNFSAGRLIKVVASLKTQCGDNLKIVLIDDADLLDEENREKIVKWLTDRGYQVLMACIGRAKPAENRIVLSPIEEKTDKAEMV